MNPYSLHIVGHSLGGHLSGIIGRSVIQQSQNRIKLLRISALDPAFPLFYPITDGSLPINVNDATLVDIIHTDADKYGAPVVTGCVDFVVNGGTRFQPGCPVGNFTSLCSNDTCSHQRSVALWAESVSTLRPTFLATSSKFPSFKIHMGIECPIIVSGAPGTYLVETNSEPPYSTTPKFSLS
ncbi:Lipase member H [Pseudolycoriella hygida]|uniref:Lipase member H n=1 Tax=Pseudolycoriella hygida TaxID=35572 RepID=A0A9Q0MK01_9DIPT|nr:Lipase member H [Pseudolycoriella hygida]